MSFHNSSFDFRYFSIVNGKALSVTYPLLGCGFESSSSRIWTLNPLDEQPGYTPTNSAEVKKQKPSFGFWLIQFWHLKISLGNGFESSSSRNLNPSILVLSHFFSNSKNLWTWFFEPDPVSCTHCTFPNAKELCGTKFYNKLKIRVYVCMKSNN